MRTIYLATILLFSLPQLKGQDNYTDEEILDWYAELRVADVSDGMDMAGLADIGLMENNMMALWKDIDHFDHVIRGIAVTARYVPTNRPRPTFENDDDFRAWEGNWYGEISPEPFVDHLKAGSILVIDANGDGDTGSIGSNNSLFWRSKGMVGIVTTGSLRDSDEVIKQKIPVYMDPNQRGRGIRPGRNEIESVQKTVQVGGVQINPGDVVVADGDGVIVVPRKYARRVAEAAQIILDNDKGGRRALYKQLGMPLDFTVEEKK
ncbi:MAG: RraA family protein [Saprospiraceae bacterium]|nr:RraA family protein [Saprospiraceae bacterium]